MRYRPPKTPFELFVHKVCIVTLGLVVFLAENSNFSSSSFSSFAEKKNYTQRLPASINKTTFDFDCQESKPFSEMSTQQETIRLVAKNCDHLPEFKNQKGDLKLHTFATSKTDYSSEFAYLARGENVFSLVANKKEYKITIIRY